MTMTNILYHGVTMTTMVKMMTFEKPCCHIMFVLEPLHTGARLTTNYFCALLEPPPHPLFVIYTTKITT